MVIFIGKDMFDRLEFVFLCSFIVTPDFIRGLFCKSRAIESKECGDRNETGFGPNANKDGDVGFASDGVFMVSVSESQIVRRSGFADAALRGKDLVAKRIVGIVSVSEMTDNPKTIDKTFILCHTCMTKDGYLMISLRLQPETEQRLNNLAINTGRTKTWYVRKLIEDHLNELEELYSAEQTFQRVQQGQERTYSLEEARKLLGLED